jgi:hypothetical protein
MGLLAFSLTVSAGAGVARADGSGFNLGFDRGVHQGGEQHRREHRWGDRNDRDHDRWDERGRRHRRRGEGAAPEIDPVGLGSVASLLVGGGLLLGARRSPRRAASE